MTAEPGAEVDDDDADDVDDEGVAVEVVDVVVPGFVVDDFGRVVVVRVASGPVVVVSSRRVDVVVRTGAVCCGTVGIVVGDGSGAGRTSRYTTSVTMNTALSTVVDFRNRWRITSNRARCWSRGRSGG